MTKKGTSLLPIIDIDTLGFDAGAHLLVKHGLLAVPSGGVLEVTEIGRAHV